MTAAVYNRYWATGGGAEKYAAVIASLLADDGDVDLLAHEHFDRDWLAERLAVDLSGCRVRVLDGDPTAASTGYDLFVNTTFMSDDPAANPASIYVVHFPSNAGDARSGWKQVVLRNTGWLRDRIGATFRWGGGFLADTGQGGPAWTDGDATVVVIPAGDGPVPVRLYLGFDATRRGHAPVAEIVVDDRVVTTATLDGPRDRREARRGREVRFEVGPGEAGTPIPFSIRSAVGPISGGRMGGVPVVGLRLGEGPASMAMALTPTLGLQATADTSWLDTYGTVVSNSCFTQRWVKLRWGVDSRLLYPPVTMYPAGQKERTILTVGRFFPGDQGHTKNQLEMVRTFAQMVDDGLEGWTFHLLGGCAADGQAYVDSVRAAAAGYPVRIHTNAPGSLVADLYASASIYWHAAGHGLDEHLHPDRHEHFGISTVEAMSAGVVPVVHGSAGLRESVRHGVDGYHFASLDGLASLTRSLIDDPAQLERMARSAAARARRFDTDSFAASFGAIRSDLQHSAPA